MKRPKRAERLAMVQRLLGEGMSKREIAKRTGFSLQWIRALVSDPDGSKERRLYDGRRTYRAAAPEPPHRAASFDVSGTDGRYVVIPVSAQWSGDITEPGAPAWAVFDCDYKKLVSPARAIFWQAWGDLQELLAQDEPKPRKKRQRALQTGRTCSVAGCERRPRPRGSGGLCKFHEEAVEEERERASA